jgi:ParB family chromosome partitioning protein
LKNDLAITERGELAVFRADETRTRQDLWDVRMQRAARLGLWDEFERAAEHKVAEQREHVEWWDATVTVRQSPGRGGNKSSADRGSISAAEAERMTSISHQQVSRWRKLLADEPKYVQQFVDTARKVAALAHNHRAQGSGENEWYTPAADVDLARAVLGSIDLDPATSEQANETVRAERIFTQDENGLEQEWHGRVWLNPPYAQPAIGQFVEKMITEYTSGRVTEGIVLTHNYTDTAWFHRAANACSAICFTRGRIAFGSPNGDKASATQGQAFFYFGSNVAEFRVQFATRGFVVMPA